MTNTLTAESPWRPTTRTFATRVAMVRHQMGWNSREAAQECGLAINAWARIEGGTLPRDMVTVVDRIVKRTGVDRVWLMFGDDVPVDYKAVVPRRAAASTRPRGRRDALRPSRFVH